MRAWPRIPVLATASAVFRRRRGRAARRVLIPLLLAVCSLFGLLSQAPPAAATAVKPPVNHMKPVPVHPVHGQKIALPKLAPKASAPKVSWPSVSSATVTPGSSLARAGSTLVSVKDVPKAAAPGKLQVSVKPRSAATAIGIPGTVFTVGHAAGNTAKAGQTRVTVSYAGFKNAYGGDYGSRLRLVELPKCALTTPKVAACRKETPLATSNDVHTSTLTAVMPLAAGTDAATTAAAAPSPSGSGGNYSATKLTEAGSWAEGGNSGAFTYSYPISTPAVPGGLQPSVSLNYNSQTVDGETSSTNNQASEIGDGWSYDPGSISRNYIPCSNPDSGAPVDATTGVPDQADLCYSAEDDVTTLNLGGASTKLVQASDGSWHAQSDGNERIQYLTGGGNSTNDGGYWEVTTPDGTEYFFGEDQLPGYASGDTSSNSSWNVPIYNYSSSGPCPKSHCYEPWQWNLDYVIDPHGDEESLFYNYETNYYDEDAAGTAVAYQQGGALSKIEYGFGTGDGIDTSKENGYPSSYAGEVDFTTAEDRTDIPTDLACASGSSCTVTSPSFWSKYRLSGITTKAMSSGSLSTVDSWALTQCHEDTSDSETNTSNQCQGATTDPQWLESIQQTTGESGNGGNPLVPATTFTGTSMPNLVVPQGTTSTFDLIPRDRMSKIVNETGGVTTVGYSGEDNSCHNGTFPSADSNTTLCYPDWWDNTDNTSTGSGTSAAPLGPTESWFNKYVVTSVTEQDTTGGDPDQVTNYTYAGAAWHYTEDSTESSKVPVPSSSSSTGVTTVDMRTWDEWRGYRTVTTETGASPDPVTKTVDTYLQGMDGDPQSGGGTSSVSVTDSQGDTVTDSNQYQGTQLEDIVYNGTSGSMVTDSVTLPWSSAATAQQAQPSPMPELQSFHLGVQETKLYTALAGGGTRESDTTTTYDSDGRETSESSVPDTSDSSQDTCTTMSYAENTSEWIMNLPKEIQVVSVSCGTTPSYPADAISDATVLYDGATSLSSDTPAKGDATETQAATSYDSSGNPQYTTETTATYDQYGRVLTMADADNRTTTTMYSPATGANPSQETVTDPQGLQTVTTYDQARGLPLTTTSPAGLTTTEAYDALGRLTAVWMPGDATSGPASEKYSYTVSNTVPSYTVTSDLEPDGTDYLSSAEIYDSLGQTVEEQVQQPGGGWDIADTGYDSNGNQTFTAGPYYAGSITEGSLVEASKDDVADEASMVYDGAGRPVQAIAEDKGTETWETDTAYGGDYTTTSYQCSSSVPKCGGTPDTVFTDGRGLETAEYQYHAGASPDPTDSSSDYDKTTYAYFPSQKLKTITDADGNQWSYTYDLAGDEITDSDPDAGKTTDTYDAADQLLTSTDARGDEISYVYDKDGRKTAEYDTTNGASETSSDELASWTYDTEAKGELTSSSSYYNGQAYTEKTMGYNAFGEPTGTEVTIPSGEGALAGTYITEDKAYAKTGALESYEDSQAGGLPQETVNYTYDAAGDPVSVTGNQNYVNSLSYDELGDPQQFSMGSSSEPAYMTDSYDPQTGALTDQKTYTGTTPATVDDLQYSYDNVGDVLSENDQPAGGAAQSQCFQYDYLGRLTQAWSQGSACSSSSSPSTSAESGAAAPYWDTYSYDTVGNLTRQTSEAPNGATTTTTGSFPSSGSAQPHAPTSETQVGTTTATTSYSYDADGNLTKTSGASLTGVSVGGQDLSWDDAGRLTSDQTSSGTTSYVYDADGNLLIEKDPGQSTLFLPDEQIVENTATSALSGTRYYTIGGSGTSTSDGATGDSSASAAGGTGGGDTIAARTSSGEVDYLIGDQQGTAGLAINASNLKATSRYYDPYGNQIGTAPASWPGDKGFVGGTTSQTTGLTNLGAREYQPQTGAFITPDNLLNPYDPQDLNGYGYASDNPATDEDPTGLASTGSNSDTDCPMMIHLGVCPNQAEANNEMDSILQGITDPIWNILGPGGFGGPSNPLIHGHGGDRSYRIASDGTQAALILFSILEGKSSSGDPDDSDVPVTEPTGGSSGSSDHTGSGSSDSNNGSTSGDDQPSSRTGSSQQSSKAGAAKSEGDSHSGSGDSSGSGCSFAPSTGVLLANGKTVPISSLKPGDTVLATNTKTGKTSPEKVSAVEINHDHDLYNLKVKSGGHTSVLRTTSNHLFWVPSLKQWITASKLKKGEHLKTAGGAVTIVVGGATPKTHDGRMWDITVPGNDDHDFYAITFAGNRLSLESAGSAVLVHNADCGPGSYVHYNSGGQSSAAYQARQEANSANFPVGPFVQSPGGNVAIAQLENGDTLTGFSQGGGYHSEDDIIDQIEKMKNDGNDPGKITDLYSERQPCSVCRSKLPGYLADNANITWSVPWPDDSTIRSASNDLLALFIRKQAGGS